MGEGVVMNPYPAIILGSIMCAGMVFALLCVPPDPRKPTKDRRPTAKVFFIGYAIAWALIQIAVGWSLISDGANARIVLLSFSGVNMLFVFLNLIGFCFAIGGAVPWRGKS